MPGAARELPRIGTGLEHGKDRRARPAKQRGANFLAAQQPLLELRKEAVLGKDRPLEVIDQFQPIDDLRRVTDAGDFLRIEPMPMSSFLFTAIRGKALKELKPSPSEYTVMKKI